MREYTSYTLNFLIDFIVLSSHLSDGNNSESENIYVCVVCVVCAFFILQKFIQYRLQWHFGTLNARPKPYGQMKKNVIIQWALENVAIHQQYRIICKISYLKDNSDILSSFYVVLQYYFFFVVFLFPIILLAFSLF